MSALVLIDDPQHHGPYAECFRVDVVGGVHPASRRNACWPSATIPTPSSSRSTPTSGVGRFTDTVPNREAQPDGVFDLLLDEREQSSRRTVA